jgi:hypothetical protein
MPQDGRNYYDDQFNRRINEIAKPGASPSSSSGSGSSGSSWGVRGAGGAIVLVAVIAIRVLLFASRSSSTYSPPTYQYTPQPTFNMPQQQFDDPPLNQRFDKGWDEGRKDGQWRQPVVEPDFKDKQ